MAPIFVGIATAGRREVLTETVRHLGKQEHLAEQVIVCPSCPDDVDEAALSTASVRAEIIAGDRGTCSQRNAIIKALSKRPEALLAFFDDDFLPAPDFLSKAATLFENHPDVVMATGEVLSDDILGPGHSVEQGMALLTQLHRRTSTPPTFVDIHNGYGCNMVIRLRAVLDHQIEFDEALPLYGWLEDVDFSRRLAAYGRIVKSSHLQGVHLGNKRGRSLGKRLGYSQVANPIYLARKRTLSARRALVQIARNVAANVAKMPQPEPWIDRRGRVAGNLLAMRDLFAGRLHPRRITELN